MQSLEVIAKIKKNALSRLAQFEKIANEPGYDLVYINDLSEVYTFIAEDVGRDLAIAETLARKYEPANAKEYSIPNSLLNA
ncbi:MAG TPA: hypothetical protein VEF04_12975 [Blastocatellia bacterium]|nr:hypothetical protein [Blastocatellia bacterium]